jgi:Zn-dependent protease with chaperone function
MTALAGTWFDGRHSRPREALLERADEATLRLTCEGEVRDFALSAIDISPRLGKTPRVLRLPGAGHVEVEDGAELHAWFHEQSRIEAWADWLERRRTAALAAAAITVLSVVLFFQFGLPAAAAWLAPRVPARVEKAMGEQVMALLDKLDLGPSRVPAARQAKLQAEFKALIAELPRERDMRLLLRDGRGIGANAFALPDGTVVMTDQLVELAKSDDELMAVLAHETGHHEHRHALRQTLESSGILLVTTMVFGDVSGSSLTVAMPTVLLETGFSRGHEREADDFAFELLKRRGISTNAFADILARLSRKHGAEPDAISYFSTHPATKERIARARAAAR